MSQRGRPLRISGIIPPEVPKLGVETENVNGADISYVYSWLNMADWALIVQHSSETNIVYFSKDQVSLISISLGFILILLGVISYRAKKLVDYQREVDKTRAQLAHAERMTSVGRFAAGVAHEINNPLTGVLTSGHILLKMASENDPAREDLEIIVNETTRCREIIRNLLDFARPAPPRKEKTSLKYLVEQSLSVLGSELKSNNIKIKRDIDENSPDLMIDVHQIEQVLINIILNAIEAMPEGGAISVSAGCEDDEAVIKIQDTGCGIPQDILGKIFDPFFTTKSAQKGTGLGLSVSYGIIKYHKGTIEAKSADNQGTTFIIKLPLER